MKWRKYFVKTIEQSFEILKLEYEGGIKKIRKNAKVYKFRS